MFIKTKSDSSVDGSYSVPLLFETLPETNQKGSQWTDCEVKDAINLVYQNLHKLDSYLAVLETDSTLDSLYMRCSWSFSLFYLAPTP
ncbi:Nuclear control of ATPase protein 2 [Quillaja saponaria]|uniref:Nuclear control of ATPase protein 2 n=1 Tax=Quillaja saponaria TaxID=32244 RepID=A0AAD7LXM2_QUISA|nr:Nuclear control of ATPase protein 2 [Quillaja saponaria]